MSDLTNERYQAWLASPELNEEERAELQAMSQEQIDDAFYKVLGFGTGGMRGVMGPGTNRLNRFTIRKVTVAVGMLLLETIPNVRTRGVVISHDNRFHSREFTLQTAEILNTMGIKTYVFDSLRATPELSFAVRFLQATAGIMITASHNPKEYNGYKVYNSFGCQWVPSEVAPLTEKLAALPDELEVKVPVAETRGEFVVLGNEVDDAYVAAVRGIQMNPGLDKRGFRIVFTPNHGASYEIAMRIFQECGYEIYPVTAQCVHDPAFGATLSPNPENADSFIEPIKLAKEVDADFIVMTDPDGDRCGIAYRASDGGYRRMTGNDSAALLMDYIFTEKQKRGTLSDYGAIFDTIVTSDLGRKIARSFGRKVESFLTGFKYIGNRIDHYEMNGNGPVFEFGYEESYGCLIAPFVRDKDGTQAILLYSEMALFYYRQGLTLDRAFEKIEEKYGYHQSAVDAIFFRGSAGAAKMKALMDKAIENPPRELCGMHVRYHEDYRNLIKTNYTTMLQLPINSESSDVVRLIFDDSSWIAIRPSGTEPKCKFYVEAYSREKPTENRAQQLLDAIKDYLTR